MKKLLFIISIWILFFASSCSVFNLGKKKSTEKETTSKIVENNDTKSDSIRDSIIEMNKAINDNLKIAVQEVKTDDQLFNEKCTEILDDILSKINVQKSSGGNNYKAFYDLEKRIFELQIQIAETQNKEVTTDTNKESISEKSTEENIRETSKTVIKMIPLWLWVILGLWFLPQIIDRVTLIINPLKGIISKISKTKS